MNDQKHDKLNICWRHLISLSCYLMQKRKQISMFPMVTKFKFNLVTSLVSDHDQDGPINQWVIAKNKRFPLICHATQSKFGRNF